VATVAIGLLDIAVLRLTLAPFQRHSLVRQEHGRTIPLPDSPHRQSLGRCGPFFAIQWTLLIAGGSTEALQPAASACRKLRVPFESLTGAQFCFSGAT
jgi:hypothetical protein